MKNNYYKTLMKLFATGLACAAILIGSPAPAVPAAGNTGGREPWAETQDEEDDSADNEGKITPHNDKKPLKEQGE